MNLTIRHPHPDEYDIVTRVWMAGWQSIGLGHAADASFEDLRARVPINVASDWDLFVADLDGEIVGMLALKPAEHQLDQLFLHPDHQGRGLGRQLLDFAKARSPGGLWLRTAEKNTRAIAFYERAGFVFERREPRPEYDRNDVYYRWSA